VSLSSLVARAALAVERASVKLVERAQVLELAQAMRLRALMMHCLGCCRSPAEEQSQAEHLREAFLRPLVWQVQTSDSQYCPSRCDVWVLLFVSPITFASL
jgi:hypothetical protein